MSWTFIALVSIATLTLAIVLVGIFERRAPIFGRVFWRGAPERRLVAITFDDGPSGHTPSRSSRDSMLRLMDSFRSCTAA